MRALIQRLRAAPCMLTSQALVMVHYMIADGIEAQRLIREYVSDALHQRCQAIDNGAYTK